MIPTSFPELPKPPGSTGKAQNLLYRTMCFAEKNSEKLIISLYLPFKGPYQGGTFSSVYRFWTNQFMAQSWVGLYGLHLALKEIHGLLSLLSSLRRPM